MNERKSPFEIMTADLFKNADFVESAWIGGREIPCIASAIAEDPRFTEFGFDDGTGAGMTRSGFFGEVKR